MLSPIQKEIVEESGNLIVRASAGTGKTHTMVSKIVYDIEYQHTHKVVAAITFTIKAANEIKERMTIDTADHFIGTNNSFAIEEIIKPFMKDVFGIGILLVINTGDHNFRYLCCFCVTWTQESYYIIQIILVMFWQQNYPMIRQVLNCLNQGEYIRLESKKRF